MTRTLAALVLVATSMGVAGCWSENAPARRPVGPAPMIEPSVEIEGALMDAAVAREAGDYDRALALFQSILAENPTITTAYLGMGEIYMDRADYHRAEPAFARAARLEPRNFDAQYGHGRALVMLDRLEDAARAFHRALTVDPQSVPANVSLATVYLRMELAESAVVFAEKAVQLQPGNGTARANLGAALESLGRNHEAIEEYLVAIELVDEPAPVMMNLVNALSKERRYRETANTAANLVAIAPSANAYERLGWAHFKLRQYDQSADAYRSAVSLDSTHWPSLNGIGVNALNAWLLSGKTDEVAVLEARDAFRRSIRVNSDQPEVIRLMSHYELR